MVNWPPSVSVEQIDGERLALGQGVAQAGPAVVVVVLANRRLQKPTSPGDM